MYKWDPTKLNLAIKESDKKRRAIAAEIGLKIGSLNQICGGRRPAYSTIFNLSRVLGKTLSELGYEATR